jgi:hypothetical protein
MSSARGLAAGLAVVLTTGLLAGCDNIRLVEPTDRFVPQAVDAEYRWLHEGWDGLRPVGLPTVVLRWDMPSGWRGEPFRVYARRAGQGSYRAIATTTSCAGWECVYTDANVAHGERYDYYVVSVDEAQGRESRPSPTVRVAVPANVVPAPPRELAAVALDGMLYLHWTASAAADAIRQYEVYLVELDGAASRYRTGGSDGTGFLDVRAVNGHVHGYRIAAVDTLGHMSELSAIVRGIPRPDFQTELMYALPASPDSSGFRFVQSDEFSPLVPGASTDAQWRLEMIDGALHLVPRGSTVVAPGVFTTALACGPGSDPGCHAVTLAPQSGYSASAVRLRPEFTYVLRVRADGRDHYGKIRVQHLGSDQQGQPLMIFGWAYQLRAGERSLSIGRD